MCTPSISNDTVSRSEDYPGAQDGRSALPTFVIVTEIAHVELGGEGQETLN